MRRSRRASGRGAVCDVQTAESVRSVSPCPLGPAHCHIDQPAAAVFSSRRPSLGAIGAGSMTPAVPRLGVWTLARWRTGKCQSLLLTRWIAPVPGRLRRLPVRSFASLLFLVIPRRLQPADLSEHVGQLGSRGYVVEPAVLERAVMLAGSTPKRSAATDPSPRSRASSVRRSRFIWLINIGPLPQSPV